MDLNPAHVFLNRLKLSALANLPDYGTFRAFLDGSGGRRNISRYRTFLRPGLDRETLRYWDRRGWSGRPRVAMFSHNPQHHGLLGFFIQSAHRLARLHGVDPALLLRSKTLEQQRAFFDTALAPLFDKALIRWLTSRRASLFGLGIPPQQYAALASAGNGEVASVLSERLRRLACGFPLADNYFAWQAFGRGYGAAGDAPLPPHLQSRNYELLRQRAGRLSITNVSYTEFLASKSEASVDRYVLLDAQDWMSDSQLNALWTEITRTAAPGARVIFRTAAEPSLLPGRVPEEILSRWEYRDSQSRALHARDRSAIYGGFHLYVLRENGR